MVKGYSQTKFPSEGEAIEGLSDDVDPDPNQRDSICVDHLAPHDRHLAENETTYNVSIQAFHMTYSLMHSCVT